MEYSVQDFEYKLAQDVAIACRGIAHAFRGGIRLPDFVDDLHRLHAAIPAHRVHILAGLPRALQSEEGGNALLRFLGRIVGQHQVGEEAEK